MYQSPIEIITKKMRTQFEDNVFKAIQDYGIVVDKEELIKALQYDRGQYEKGFADGMLARKDEWISVEEGLPVPYADVIVYDKASGVIMDSMLSTGEFVNGIVVTHWMPLPEAPKNEN